MIQYLPWSKNVLQSCINATKEGMIPTIDLELTANGQCQKMFCRILHLL